MKILITGGAGFIGSHITKQLLEKGEEVVVYDNYSTTKKSSVFSHQSAAGNSSSQTTDDRRLTTVEGDVNDAKLLTESLQGVDGVIHMASFLAVEESVKNPLKYLDNNVMGAGTLLTCMREAGVKKIIFSSSATVYGDPKSLPIGEEAPLSAANPYGATKIAIEALCQSFYKTDGFDTTILRYFNPYGPGEDHQPEVHAIPNFIKSGLEHQAIPLYWKGEQERDFIYIEDLAAAHVAVLPLSGYNVFNVSTGQGTKVIDVVNKLSDIFGYKLEIEDKGNRAGDVMATYASNQKLKEATDWKIKTNLDEGLAKTVEWFKQR